MGYFAYFYFLYLIWDIINLIRANNPSYLLDRYLVELKFLLLYCGAIICLWNKKVEDQLKICKTLFFAVVMAAICICCLSIAFYIAGRTPYIEKFSAIVDYNVFSEYVFFGMIITIYLICMKSFTYPKLILLISTIVIFEGSAVLLSGSRRGVIFFALGIALFSIYFVFFHKNRSCTGNLFKTIIIKVLSLLVLACIIISGICLCVKAFEYNIDQYAKNHTIIHETSNKARYETIVKNEALATRTDIWAIALQEITDFNQKDILFGKGGSYQYELYEKKHDSTIEKFREKLGIEENKARWMTPHNIVLAMMLDGGIIKVIFWLLVLLVVFVYIIKLKEISMIFLFLTLYMAIMGTYILGGDKGILSDDIFLICTILLLFTRKYIICKKEECTKNEKIDIVGETEHL